MTTANVKGRAPIDVDFALRRAHEGKTDIDPRDETSLKPVREMPRAANILI